METDYSSKVSPVTEEQRTQLSEDVDLFMYSTGDTILAEGDEGDFACELVCGTAKVLRYGDVVATLNTGEYFGSIAALTNVRHTATIVAADLCVVRKISRHKFRLLVQKKPELLDHLC